MYLIIKQYAVLWNSAYLSPLFPWRNSDQVSWSLPLVLAVLPQYVSELICLHLHYFLQFMCILPNDVCTVYHFHLLIVGDRQMFEEFCNGVRCGSDGGNL